jgi:hypothetical protein
MTISAGSSKTCMRAATAETSVGIFRGAGHEIEIR